MSDASFRVLSRADIDDDGATDILAEEGRAVVVYLRRGGCLRRLTRLEPNNGRIAFARVDTVSEKQRALRDLSVDTWLYHGDRERTRWRWTGTRYLNYQRPELIPGPRQP